MLVGLTLVFFVQTTGQPNILFYASTVLKSVGFQSNEAASLASTGVGVVKVVSTVPATVFVDKVGSKTFLCIGSSVMAVSLVTMGLVNRNIHMNFTNICRSQSPEDTYQSPGNLTGVTNGSLKDLFSSMALPERLFFDIQRNLDGTRTGELNRTTPVGGESMMGSHTESGEVSVVLKWVSLASLLVYVAAFSIGLGPSKCFSSLILCNYLFTNKLSAWMICPSGSFPHGQSNVFCLCALILLQTVLMCLECAFYKEVPPTKIIGFMSLEGSPSVKLGTGVRLVQKSFRAPVCLSFSCSDVSLHWEG